MNDDINTEEGEDCDICTRYECEFHSPLTEEDKIRAKGQRVNSFYHCRKLKRLFIERMERMRQQ